MHESYTPSPRPSASDDHDMMKYVWDLYGCHVIDFLDENGDFYENKLIKISKFYRWLVMFVCLMVFSATFNDISVIS